jgi:hypothetical protein
MYNYQFSTPPDEAETHRDFDKAIAGDDSDNDCGHDESVCDILDDRLAYG